MQTTVMTVTGPVSSDSLGMVLPHEHLFYDFRGPAVPDPQYPELFGAPVTSELAWLLRERPYSCLDHLVVDDETLLAQELSVFSAAGGRTVVDLTLASVGRSPEQLRQLSQRTGLQIIMGSGYYMEEFHIPADIELSVDSMAETLIAEHHSSAAVRPGVIGEIGVSPDFTAWERRSLRAAAIAQREIGVPFYIHIPSWERLGDEVVDIVVDEHGVAPEAVVLCHMDASGEDSDYQRRLADRGVWLEFDMIGMPFWLTGEGQCPDPHQTAGVVAALIAEGHADRLLLSHDVFLKTMLRRFGGNGFGYVPTAFAERLIRAGVAPEVVGALLTTNGRRLFELSSADTHLPAGTLRRP
jgi:phosphotriesterase-related protein